MTAEELLLHTKNEIIGAKDTITSIAEAELIHALLIETRTSFFLKTQLGIMPHYRGEQNFGWIFDQEFSVLL